MHQELLVIKINIIKLINEMNGCKYYKQEEQVSYDYKQTWENTGNYRKGELYEPYSDDCPMDARWKEVPGGYICEGGTKYKKLILEVTDDGINYKIKYPAEYKKGDLIEMGSFECNYKWYGRYVLGTKPTYRPPLDPIKIVLCEGNNEVLTEIDVEYEEFYQPFSGYVGTCVTTISGSTFESSLFLTDIDLPGSLKTIGDRAFSGCRNLTGITIPSSVNNIGSSAFAGCPFSSVTLGDAIESIGNGAFSCSALTSFSINTVIPPSIDGNIFRRYTNFKICVPDASVDAYKSSSGWTQYVDRIYGFSDCPSEKFISHGSASTKVIYCNSNSELTKSETMGSNYGDIEHTDAFIGNCVTSIGGDAFYQWTALTSIDIPNSVTSIGYRAFYRCSGLTSVVIPNSVTSIGSNAFCSCNSLTSVTIGGGVTSIGSSAFAGCSSLSSVAIPNSVTSIENRVFSGCRNLTGITIPSSVNDIGSSAFAQCSSLTSIDIPNSVTSIGNEAFRECISATTCNIGSGVIYIGQSAFESCSVLTDVIIPDNVRSIGKSAFRVCYNLSAVTISSGVTDIENYTFYGCHFNSIIIPSGVTSIGDGAFASNSRLHIVTVESTTPPTLGSSVFDDRFIEKIYVPSESVDAYKTANRWSTYASRIQAIP